MCGRFAQSSSIQQLVKRFAIEHALLDWVARYNIAPSQNIPAITQGENGRSLHELRWGLIPHWAKDASMGARLTNARSETVDKKPAFRQAFRSWRCVIPADGFYEWRGEKVAGKTIKRPYYVALQDREMMGFAGLYEAWQGPDGGIPIQTCTILTTGANELMAPIHHRMPVILNRADEDTWLDESVSDRDVLMGCLRAYPSELMEAYEVSPRVNKTDFDGPECIERFTPPPPETPPQMNLFE